MIFLRYGMNDPRVVYGSPNVRFDAQGRGILLEPGDDGYTQLAPGTPGYQAPPAKPRPRRQPRRPSSAQSNPEPNVPHPMNLSFQYIIYRIKTLFTAKPDLRDAVSEGQFLDALATSTGRTRPECEDFLRKIFALIVSYARQSIPVDFVLKLFRILPKVRGSYTNANPDDAAVRGNLDVAVVIHPDVVFAVQDGTAVEKTDEKTETAPEIETIRSSTGALNKYGVGTMQGTEVEGDFFREGRTGAAPPQVFQCNGTDGSDPIAVGVLFATPTHLVLGGAPTGTTGTKYLMVKAAYGGELFTVCPKPITAA